MTLTLPPPRGPAFGWCGPGGQQSKGAMALAGENSGAPCTPLLVGVEGAQPHLGSPPLPGDSAPKAPVWPTKPARPTPPRSAPGHPPPALTSAGVRPLGRVADHPGPPGGGAPPPGTAPSTPLCPPHSGRRQLRAGGHSVTLRAINQRNEVSSRPEALPLCCEAGWRCLHCARRLCHPGPGSVLNRIIKVPLPRPGAAQQRVRQRTL